MSASVRVSLSAAGEGLEVEMPSGHTVNVPTNEKGIRFIFMALTEQEMAKASGRPTGIGTTASPTQVMVNKWLKGNEVKRFTEKGEVMKETLTLEDLGLAP